MSAIDRWSCAHPCMQRIVARLHGRFSATDGAMTHNPLATTVSAVKSLTPPRMRRSLRRVSFVRERVQPLPTICKPSRAAQCTARRQSSLTPPDAHADDVIIIMQAQMQYSRSCSCSRRGDVIICKYTIRPFC